MILRNIYPESMSVDSSVHPLNRKWSLSKRATKSHMIFVISFPFSYVKLVIVSVSFTKHTTPALKKSLELVNLDHKKPPKKIFLFQ